MRVVIADTTPLRYLAEIDHLGVVPQLFQTVYIPSAVYEELQRPSTPEQVRRQLSNPPAWLEIVTETSTSDPGLLALHPGERAAIALGVAMRADLIVIDERKGTAAAVERGFETTGTLGVLLLAAERGLIDLEAAFNRLRATTFRHTEAMLTTLLAKHKKA